MAKFYQKFVKFVRGSDNVFFLNYLDFGKKFGQLFLAKSRIVSQNVIPRESQTTKLFHFFNFMFCPKHNFNWKKIIYRFTFVSQDPLCTKKANMEGEMIKILRKMILRWLSLITPNRVAHTWIKFERPHLDGEAVAGWMESSPDSALHPPNSWRWSG